MRDLGCFSVGLFRWKDCYYPRNSNLAPLDRINYVDLTIMLLRHTKFLQGKALIQLRLFDTIVGLTLGRGSPRVSIMSASPGPVPIRVTGTEVSFSIRSTNFRASEERPEISRVPLQSG